MKRRIFVAIVAAAGFALFAGAQDAQAFELLNKMMGHRHGGCCEPACCEPEPTCCEPAPTCCAPEPTCCEEPSCCDPCCDPCCKRRGLLHRLFHRHRCCKPACCEPACEPACCEPEPSCCCGH